ncbi:alpha/beta fold hydrolase [Thermoleptolyngbya sichuanensis A183]|uniref:Alpha/beta fold hydrolase n=1 Tax=Thermoleptolyngbya sichuanensis A183 TaxID=2737172 RepID=A0A6M8B8U8_9CYAN|nr:alpha/beta fold hydrolase [Thermoleptolyngbya sichuanensis]QKD82572.1 alpha/beta fold hydrolase [Thermoleptolyngbya sichuanensis A183]
MRFTKTKRLYRLLISMAALYVAACGLMWAGQTRLIFRPDADIRTTPDAVGLRYETVDLPVGTGRVRGWWIGANRDDAPTVLYFHGTGSNLGDLPRLAAQIHELGWAAFFIDYRGYGQSQGSFPSEQSVYADAIAALDYLTQTRRIPPQRIVVMGRSIGGAIALDLAAHNPDLAALVVESSFTSMRDMIRYFVPVPLLPVDLLLHQRFDSLAKVRSLQMPLLVIHGTGDRVVPVHMGQALYEAAPPPKELLLIPQAGHSNLRRINRTLYFQTLQRFVTRYAEPAAAGM